MREGREYDPKTNEPILFELKHRMDPQERLSLSTRSAWLDWGFTRRASWVWDSMPASVAGMVLLLIVLYATVTVKELEDPRMVILGFLAFMGAFFALVELSDRHRREYLTATRLVRRYGLLGWGREEIPLTTIERVEVEYSRYRPFGEEWKLGDLHVFTRGYSTWVDHVFEPETAAQAILDVNGFPRSRGARRSVR